jgi:hypothetical protein
MGARKTLVAGWLAGWLADLFIVFSQRPAASGDPNPGGTLDDSVQSLGT